MVCDKAPDGSASETAVAATPGQEWAVELAVLRAHPDPHHCYCRRGEGSTPLLSALTMAPNVRADTQFHVLTAKPGQFRNSQTSLHGQEQQRVVALSSRSNDRGWRARRQSRNE